MQKRTKPDVPVLIPPKVDVTELNNSLVSMDKSLDNLSIHSQNIRKLLTQP